MAMVPGSRGDGHRIGIVVADQSEVPFGMELRAVEGDDPGRLLAPVLQGVQPQCRQRRSVGMAENAEYPALLAQGVAVEFVKSLSHGLNRSAGPVFAQSSIARNPVHADVCHARICPTASPARRYLSS